MALVAAFGGGGSMPMAAFHPLLPFTGGTKRRPGIRWSGSTLIEAVPHQNFPGGHSRKLSRHHKRASIRCPDAKENPGDGEDAGAQEQGDNGWGGAYPVA